MTFSLIAAVSLNNTGVALLGLGQQKQAFDTFRLALETFNQDESQETSGYAAASDDASIGDLVLDGTTHQAQSVVIVMHLEAAGDDAEDVDLHFFNRALVLRSDEVRDQDVVFASVLYNIALVNHIRGVHQTRMQDRCFRAAKKLYQLASEIIQIHDDQSIFDDILFLALVNNLGHIQAPLGQTMEAQEQNDILRSIVGVGPRRMPTKNSNVVKGEAPTEDEVTMIYKPPQVDEEDYFFFYLNALEDIVAAPAA